MIRRNQEKENGFTKTQCLRICGIPRSSFNSWENRKKDKDGKLKAKKLEEEDIMNKFRIIMKKLGYIPGKRTFHTQMKRRFNIKISLKRCAKIMDLMNIEATRPLKDAYKNQATYNHMCASPENKIKQEFLVEPRRVILTDITYLYHGICRDTFYMCVFYDAFNREPLGIATHKRMTTELVKEAYNEMMQFHKHELKLNCSVYIHSDQGSQYLETSFKQLLEDDGFIQSVSRRGNSQDNAPMESFFGRMKSHILPLLALCPDFETAKALVEGYIHDYTYEHYQYSLGGLTPAEYYTLVTTGIYPADFYYGVSADRLYTPEKLLEMRRAEADKKAEKVRERYAKKKAKEDAMRDPMYRIPRDEIWVQKQIKKWERDGELITNHLAKLKEILEGIKVALNYIENVPENILAELRESNENWKKHPELAYIYEMDNLF